MNSPEFHKPDARPAPQFDIGPAPHITSGDGVRGMMLDVVIALLPALGVSTYFFGPRVLLIAALSITCCVIFELLFCLILKKPVRIGDLSAAVTGLILTMCLPAATPYWLVVIASFAAIVLIKQLLGGLGKFYLNPALTGYAALLCFPKLISRFTPAGTYFWVTLGNTKDVVLTNTPIQDLQQGVLPVQSLRELLLGLHSGGIGEVPSAMLLLGGLYLLARKVISLRIPLCYLGTVAVLTYLFPQGGNDPLQWMLCQLLGGTLLLGAFFMATDCMTSPITPWGQVIYGIGCGALTVFLRYFGIHADGVCIAILVMNACVRAFDYIGTPRRFGVPFFAFLKRKRAE